MGDAVNMQSDPQIAQISDLIRSWPEQSPTLAAQKLLEVVAMLVALDESMTDKQISNLTGLMREGLARRIAFYQDVYRQIRHTGGGVH